MGVGFELSDAHVEQVSENDCGCDSLCMHTFVQKKMHYKRSQPEKKREYGLIFHLFTRLPLWASSF
jgi:hypothetical protein